MKQEPAPPSHARVCPPDPPHARPSKTIAAGLILALLLGLFHPSAIAADGGVRLSPRLDQGRTLSYDISRTLRVQQTPGTAPGGSDAPVTPVVSSTTLDLAVRLDVGSVRADGTTEVAVEVQSLLLAIESGGVTRSFRHPSETPEADRAEPARPSAIEMVGKALVVSKPRIVINREGGVGEILGLDNLEEVMTAAGKLDRTVSAVELSMWGPESLRELLLPMFQPSAPESPARVLNPADRWTVRRTVDLASLGSLVIDESWTMDAAHGEGAAASGVVTVTPMPPRGIVSAAPTLELGAAAGKASLAWDTSAASLTAFSRALDVTINLTLGDIRVSQTQSSTTSINRRN